jgi:hypothetical protein
MAEGRDWTLMARAECPDCGYDAGSIGVDGFDDALVFEAAAWGNHLEAADPVALRAHGVDGVWSGLEYACHVRDLFAVFAGRVDGLREGEPNPIIWWDHAAAVIEERYNEQSVSDVVEDLANNAMILSAATIGVEGDMWSRSAERRPGDSLTIVDLVRFSLHESFHHRLDSLDAVATAIDI